MNSLADKRILPVEDEYPVAALAEDMPADLGAVAVGPAYNLRDGLALAGREAIDAAVLDVSINGERSDPIADALAARNIPFVLATGYGERESGKGETPVLGKPYSLEQLAAALRRALPMGESVDRSS
jgi:DNA-binding NtrC family response regulator